MDTTVDDLSKESVRIAFENLPLGREEGRTVVFFIVDMNVEQLTKIGNLLDEGQAEERSLAPSLSLRMW